MALVPTHAPRVVIAAPAETTAPASLTDEQLAAAAVQSHDQAVAMRDGAVEAAVRTGDLLREAQRRCRERGQSWGDWLMRHWPKSRKTADRYVALSYAHEREQSPQVPQISESRVTQKTAAVTAHPSVRAALEAIGYGVERDEPEPEGPSNVPTDDLMREPTEAEQATIDRLSADQAKADQERAAKRLRERDEWRAKRQAEERQGLTAEEAARRAAAAAEEAKKRAEREAELAAMKAAEDRDPLKGPPPTKPKPQPADADEIRSVAKDCEAMEQLILGLQRRWGLVLLQAAPKVERYGRVAKHPRDEEHDLVSEWVNGGTEAIRRLKVMAQEDAKVVAQARKQRGQS